MLSPEKQRQLAEEDKKIEEERKQAEEASRQKQSFLRGKKVKIWGIIGVILLLSIGAFAYARSRPGKWDKFADCLNEKGMVMYGAIEWCSYTQRQAGMFGKSFKRLDYRDYTKLQGIKKTPTWVFEGEWLEGVQSFERLAATSGCSYSGGQVGAQLSGEGEGNLIS
ncbi:hypothetical protein HYU14_02295 [Candidatus Woesearchaeota archaeon]|nr:hypothetical protein [Candidatus Woesearchaeota archaeon]